MAPSICLISQAAHANRGVVVSGLKGQPHSRVAADDEAESPGDIEHDRLTTLEDGRQLPSGHVQPFGCLGHGHVEVFDELATDELSWVRRVVHRHWLGSSLEPFDLAARLAGLREVVGVVEAEPGVGGAVECSLEADGELSGDWRFAGAHGGQRSLLDLQMRRRLGIRQAQRFDAVLPNRLAGMVWVVREIVRQRVRFV